jgi:hypothetical protein
MYTMPAKRRLASTSPAHLRMRATWCAHERRGVGMPPAGIRGVSHAVIGIPK